MQILRVLFISQNLNKNKKKLTEYNQTSRQHKTNNCRRDFEDQETGEFVLRTSVGKYFQVLHWKYFPINISDTEIES